METAFTTLATEEIEREINALLGTVQSITERAGSTHALLSQVRERIFGVGRGEKDEAGSGRAEVKGSLQDLRDALQKLGSYAERIHVIAIDLDVL